jgi:hypothetical protein
MNLRNLLLVVFAVNALFWGLLPHSVHCKALAMVSSMKCPPHSVHLVMSVVFYFAALFVAQREYLMK